MTDPSTAVDLRVAARALLFGEGPLAITSAALDRIAEIAASTTPVMIGEADLGPLAFDDELGDDGFGRLRVSAGVAVIPLRGVLTPRPSFLSILFGGSSGGLLGFRSDLREALGHNDVDAIVIDVNSPGGSVSLITEIAAELREARGTKPITAVANTMMASAAYEIAAQADSVVATPSAFVGSIGVYIVHVDRSALNEAVGVKPTYVYAGKYKVEGNSDTPLDDTARQALQAEVDDFYGLFVDDVAAGRGATADEVRTGFGEGRVLTAQRAVEASLVDRVATLETIVRESGKRGAAGAGARASSGRRRNMRAGTTDDRVRARLAEIATLTPPVQSPGGTSA